MTTGKDNKDQYFKGQHTDEEFVCFFRHHWVVLVKDILIFFLVLLAGILAIAYGSAIQDALYDNQAAKLLFVGVYGVATFFVHRFFIRMLKYFLSVGVITDMRVFENSRSVFLKDRSDSIDMGQIQNIEKEQNGILPNIFGYGDIKIYLNASDKVIEFHHVPNVQFHYRCINRQKESRKLSIMRESGGLFPRPSAATPTTPFVGHVK